MVVMSEFLGEEMVEGPTTTTATTEKKLEVWEVVQCQLSHWTQKLPRELLRPNVRLVLSAAARDYLMEDGVRLPKCLEERNEGWSTEEDLGRTADEEEEVEELNKKPRGTEAVHQSPSLLHKKGGTKLRRNYAKVLFLCEHEDVIALSKQLEIAIEELGGAVLPRLNWSTPEDATWMLGGTGPSCATVRDVFLVLKSSSRIMDDFIRPFHWCNDKDSVSAVDIAYEISLDQQHTDVIKGMEFRCFVHNDMLIGICQRNLQERCCDDNFLLGHSSLEWREHIVSAVTNLFRTHLSPNLTMMMRRCVFDVYLDRNTNDCNKLRPWLIDMAPWRGRTDPLLFAWAELEAVSNNSSDIIRRGRLPELRLMQEEEDARLLPIPTCMPREFWEMSSTTSTIDAQTLLDNISYEEMAIHNKGLRQ
eukprot:GHVS01107501.1.p2 GENE.GHVS01107501.1~~GHVS01107501.1.p2  ORF type:complete len:418 (-),score=65.01 GHVS01107501.1:1868-3121(-)